MLTLKSIFLRTDGGLPDAVLTEAVLPDAVLTEAFQQTPMMQDQKKTLRTTK
jgi:hypothetical protein